MTIPGRLSAIPPLAAALLGCAAFAAPAMAAGAAPLSPDRQAFRDLYEELVETNTTLSSGSCTRAAEQISARLARAGMAPANLHILGVDEHPDEKGLVAIYPGTASTGEGTGAGAIVLLAHLDVVEADAKDWVRDPFTLIEEDGLFYARGAADDKAMAAIWADMLVRFAQDGYVPQKTIKMVLTCGEETDTAFNGADWLARNRRALIDADFALNEGGGGRTDDKGTILVQNVQVGEKLYQDYDLVVTNPGGHSSQPVPDNAIYRMAAALQKIGAHEFDIEFTDTTRVYFEKVGAMRGDETGAAMLALLQDPDDADALAIVDRDKMYHSMLRTTCVATKIDGGHAVNALPQRVHANVNCRIFPGHDPVAIMETLTQVIDDPAVSIARARTDKPVAKSPPMDPDIIGPMQTLLARHYPGVPLIPTMSTGATDGLYLSAVGIPTYGVPGLYTDPKGSGAHGLDEHIAVDAVYRARDYLTDLVKAYAG